MRQKSFNFDDNDDNKPAFDRKADFFTAPVKKVDKSNEPSAPTDNKPAEVPIPVNPEPPKAKVDKKPVILTVTQLNRSIKFALSDTFPGKITLEGEISNYKHHGSGHVYLSLKDEYSTIAAVMWRSSAGKLKFRPENGMAVVCSGRLEVYEPQGKYQLILDKLEPAGVGALELAFRQLAEKLEKEGLFAKERKRPLPPYPMTIGIVTSQTGAAVKDICQTLSRRWPFARKILYPVTVQGAGSSAEIAAAIRDINKRNNELKIDTLIVGRGGGSLEDLWAFNEEPVARAIVESKIPVISGVGHEIDTTIADMVADVRAATPTAAAELAVPVASELLDTLTEYARTLNFDMRELIKQNKEYLQAIIGRPFFARPISLLEPPRQQLDELQMKLQHQISVSLNRQKAEMDKFQAALRKIEPHNRISALKIDLENCKHKMNAIMQNAISRNTYQLNSIQMKLEKMAPASNINIENQQLDNLRNRLDNSTRTILRENSNLLEQYCKLLNNLDHRQVLKRGYTVTRTKDDNKIVNNITNLKKGDQITTEFIDGTIDSEVK